jgi:transposase-like protein
MRKYRKDLMGRFLWDVECWDCPACQARESVSADQYQRGPEGHSTYRCITCGLTSRVHWQGEAPPTLIAVERVPIR